MKQSLLEKAKKVLEANYENPGYTVPSKGLYPFQWNWDSGLIAIGYANYDIERAKMEITTLMNCQWENGFVPHIIYHGKSLTYFPGPDFHQASLHPLSSKKYQSTGMTQPPVIGFVLLEMYKRAKNKKDVLEFISGIIDKVYKNHEYLYLNRDPFQEGLVYIYHNWESGTDNSPIWDPIWETMDSPVYSFERRDTSQVDSKQRPTNREYDHYLYLIDIAKQYNYDDKKIAENSPFLVQDPLFNAMLIKSNAALLELYELCDKGREKIIQLKKWQEKSIKKFNTKLFDNELGVYVHYDLRNQNKIRMRCSSSFVPIFANIPSPERAAKLIAVMNKRFGGINRYLCSSFDPKNNQHDPKRYWRGPVWININWMLYHGLKDYGFYDLALQIKNDSLELIEKYGFYEYFDPRRNSEINGSKGYGGSNFSWTAALCIDFLNNEH